MFTIHLWIAANFSYQTYSGENVIFDTNLVTLYLQQRARILIRYAISHHLTMQFSRSHRPRMQESSPPRMRPIYQFIAKSVVKAKWISGTRWRRSWTHSVWVHQEHVGDRKRLNYRWKGSFQRTNDSATTLLLFNLLATPHFNETIKNRNSRNSNAAPYDCKNLVVLHLIPCSSEDLQTPSTDQLFPVNNVSFV